MPPRAEGDLGASPASQQQLTAHLAKVSQLLSAATQGGGAEFGTALSRLSAEMDELRRGIEDTEVHLRTQSALDHEQLAQAVEARLQQFSDAGLERLYCSRLAAAEWRRR